MANWVRTDRGYVNLDYGREISRFKRTVSDRQGTRQEYAYRISMSDDSVVEAADAAFEVTSIPCAFVPAAPGSNVVVVSVMDDTNERPKESDLWVKEPLVAAWAISGSGKHFVAEPVLADTPASNEIILIKNPDGSILAPADCTYETLDEAKRSILRDAQRAWDDQQAKQKAQAAAEPEA